MGFLNDKSLDQMLDEEEKLDERTRLEKKRRALEEEKTLRKAQQVMSKEEIELYKDKGRGVKGSGMDWDALRLRL